MMNKIRHVVSGLGIYGVVFSVMLIAFGIINAKKVVRFWVYDETDYNEWSVSLNSKSETDYISNFWGKVQFVNFNGLMRNLTGQHEMNGVVKLNNGYLVTPSEYTTDEDLQYKADQLHTLDTYLKEQNIPMLFFMCPTTSGKYDPQLPIGVSDYGNDNADRFIQMISDYGIEYIDLREEIHAEGLSHYDMMYRTDHHWTTEAGFYAYTKLLPWIQSKTGAKVDKRVADLSNYTLTTYEKWHLGSNGQRTGIYFAGIDDFVLITPNFETALSNGSTEGSFTDMLINYAPLENREYTSRYTYDWVLSKGTGVYLNNNAQNDVKVLMVADSFFSAVNPYMLLSFKEVRYFYNRSSSELTKAYIEEYDPDVIVLMYYPGVMWDDHNAFSFNVH